MSDQLIAETSTWQHTTLTTDKYPCPRWDLKPRSQQASGRRQLKCRRFEISYTFCLRYKRLQNISRRTIEGNRFWQCNANFCHEVCSQYASTIDFRKLQFSKLRTIYSKKRKIHKHTQYFFFLAKTGHLLNITVFTRIQDKGFSLNLVLKYERSF